MLCTRCGKKSAHDSVYCMYCGAKLVENDSTADVKEPSLLNADAEQTMCLDADELQAAFLEKYPTESPVAELPETEEKSFYAEPSAEELLKEVESQADSYDITNDYSADSIKNYDADDTMVLEGIKDEFTKAFASLNENFDTENTVILEENDDNFVTGIISADKNADPEQTNDNFFANNETIPDISKKSNADNNGKFSDNSSTMTFAAIQEDDYIPELPQPLPPPVYESVAPVYEEASRPRRTSGKKEKFGFFRLFSAGLLSAAAILFMLVFNATLSIKLGAAGHIVRSNISRFNGRTLLSAEYDGNEFANTLYNSLGFGSAAGGMATQSSFRDYMLRTDFLNYAGRTADNYISYIIDGDGSDPSITAQDFVYDFIKANNRASIEEFEYKMTEQDYLFMQANLEKDGFDRSMSIASWGNSLGFSLRNLKYLFSYLSIAVFFGLALIMLIWIAVLLKGRTRYYATFYSSILKTSGILIFVVGAFLLLGSAVAFAFTNNVMYYVISHSLITFSLVAMCIGVAEFVLGMIFHTIRKTTIRKEKN